MEVLLLQGIAQGDQQAFARFYDRFSGLLYSLAIRILNDPKEAEDVLQALQQHLDLCVLGWWRT